MLRLQASATLSPRPAFLSPLKRDDFGWLEGRSTNKEAPEVSLWGSWMVALHPLPRPVVPG